MKSVLVTMKMDVEDSSVEELRKTVDHHIEGFIDTDSYPEIKAIYDAQLEVYDRHPLKEGLFELFDLVNNILEKTQPRYEDEEDLYAELSNIRHHLEIIGYYTR